MKPAIPTKLKKLQQQKEKIHGKYGTIKEMEIETTEMPRPFSKMTKTEKRIWNKLGGMLYELGLLAEKDRYVFSRLVHSIYLIEKMKDECEKNGYVIDNKKNAHYAIMERETDVVYKYARLFGLSPSGQAGLEIAGINKGKEKEFVFELNKKIG